MFCQCPAAWAPAQTPYRPAHKHKKKYLHEDKYINTKGFNIIVNVLDQNTFPFSPVEDVKLNPT